MDTPTIESTRETSSWCDYLLPLPHEMTVSGSVRIAPDQLGFVTSPDASPMVKQVVDELRSAYRTKSGANPTGTSFLVHIGRLSADGKINERAVDDASRLRQAAHSDQAYLIRPVGSEALVVAGLEDRGIFYGVQTLRQLLIAKLTETEAVVPLATITDWPDFEERGLWNSGLGTRSDIPWLAGLKLNFEHINHPVDPDPKAQRCPPLPIDLIEWARERAFHILPHCWHYDFWNGSPGLGERYPELIGKGASARNPASVATPGYHPEALCPCASNPLLRKLLTEWMQSAAEQGVREVSLWMTEYQPCRCACDTCRREGSHQLLLETKASIWAIQEARKRYPNLVGRLFLTFNLSNPEEERECRRCLSLIPADGSVKAECVYGLQGPFDDYAQAGNWVANYGVSFPLGGSWRSRGALRLRLYPDPEGLHERIAYLGNAGYRGMYNASSITAGGRSKGLVERHLCDFHISMLAEWSWNANGRDSRQFAAAWLVRHGYTPAERALQWMDGMLQIESVVFRAMDSLPAVAKAMSSGETLQLGGPPGFEAFPDEERFEEMIRTATRCGAMAESMDARDLATESRYLVSALGMLRGIYRLSRAMTKADTGTSVEVEGALRRVTEEIGDMIAAAEDQTLAWTTMPPSTRALLDKYTEDYWRNWDTTFQSVARNASRSQVNRAQSP